MEGIVFFILIHLTSQKNAVKKGKKSADARTRWQPLLHSFDLPLSLILSSAATAGGVEATTIRDDHSPALLAFLVSNSSVEEAGGGVQAVDLPHGHMLIPCCNSFILIRSLRQHTLLISRSTTMSTPTPIMRIRHLHASSRPLPPQHRWPLPRPHGRRHPWHGCGLHGRAPRCLQ